MKIQLSEHFTYDKLLRFVFPSIVMMIFTSIYGVVDGLFVSNYAGKTAFAAINLIMPFIMALSALGFMVGTGGSAIVAKTLGEGKEKEVITFFISDDKNHLPIRLDMYLNFGSAKAFLKSVQGNRYPMTSVVKKK